MPLDPRRAELLATLRGCIASLEQRTTGDPAAIERFSLEDVAVRYWLQVAIQCCLDVGDSILGELDLAEPGRYRDIFGALAHAGVIDASLVRPMEQLSDFRNALVHAYAGLNPNETWPRASQGATVLSRFAEQIDRWERTH